MSSKSFPSKASARTDPSLTRLSQLDPHFFSTFKTSDWDDSQTDLANLGGVGGAGSAAAGDKLWEDNWDDDDIEEEFSTQLRFALSHPAYMRCLNLNPCCFLSGRNSKRRNRAQSRCSIDHHKPEPDGVHPKLIVALLCVQTTFLNIFHRPRTPFSKPEVEFTLTSTPRSHELRKSSSDPSR